MKLKIKDFSEMIDSFQKFFQGILPINSDGIFEADISLEEAEQLATEANKHWTGPNLEVETCEAETV